MGVVINHSIIQEIKEEQAKDAVGTGTVIQLSQEKIKNMQLQALVKGLGEEVVKLRLQKFN